MLRPGPRRLPPPGSVWSAQRPVVGGCGLVPHAVSGLSSAHMGVRQGGRESHSAADRRSGPQNRANLASILCACDLRELGRVLSAVSLY